MLSSDEEPEPLRTYSFRKLIPPPGISRTRKAEEERMVETPRLSKLSKKKSYSKNKSGWRTWDLERPSPSRYIKTYSRIPASGDLFDKLVEGSVPRRLNPPTDDSSHSSSSSPLIAAETSSPREAPLFYDGDEPDFPPSSPEKSFASKEDPNLITSTPNHNPPKKVVVTLQPLSDSLLDYYMKPKNLCVCGRPDEGFIDCDYCPGTYHAACHGLSNEKLQEINNYGLLWSCPDCEKKKEEVQASLPASPLPPASDAELIPAKGGKKWRRTMILTRPTRSSKISLRPQTLAVSKISEGNDTVESNHDVSSLLVSMSNLSIAKAEDDPTKQILYRCGQKIIIPFSNLYDEAVMKRSIKIGEGSYGEVFLLDALETEEKNPRVLKIIPVDGEEQINGDDQTALTEIISEIRVSLDLCSLNKQNKTQNFVLVHRCLLCFGDYPNILLDLWDAYDEEKNSLNDRPDFLGPNQKYVAFEFENGGRDLESYTLCNASQGLAVFNQVAHALAVAEEEFCFEHRDLHWGNILVNRTEDSTLQYYLDDSSIYHVQTFGIKATIIDFSLSRLSSKVDDQEIYKDLSKDKTLFTATGDYQFDIYRLMKEKTKNEWRAFNPYTNVLWLHYLLDKLTSSVTYKSKKSRIHRSSMSILRNYKKIMLEYISAKHFVLSEGVPLNHT